MMAAFGVDKAVHNILGHLQASFSSASSLYNQSIDGIQEASPAGQPSLGFGPGHTFMVEAWCGTEALHTSSALDILALSSNAHIDLASCTRRWPMALAQPAAA